MVRGRRVWHASSHRVPCPPSNHAAARLGAHTRACRVDGSGEYSAEAIEAIRRGYLVNAKLFDEAFGRVLRAVRELGEWERTIIVFHGDHGLSLGEYGVTGKGKLLDVDTRVPMVLRAPRMPSVRPGLHRVMRGIVELVDVFPTLCDLACIPCPPRAPRGPRPGSIGGSTVARYCGTRQPSHLANASTISDGVATLDGEGAQGGKLPVTAENAPPLDGVSLVPWLLSASHGYDEPSEGVAGRRRTGGSDRVGAGEVEGEDRGISNGASRGVENDGQDEGEGEGGDGAVGDRRSAVAISTYPRCLPVAPKFSLSCNGVPSSSIHVMGTSVRSRTHRFVVWARWDRVLLRPVLLSLAEHASRGEIELYAFAEGTTDAGGTMPRQINPKDLGTEASNLAAPPVVAVRLCAADNSTVDGRACQLMYAQAVAAWPPSAPPLPSCADERHSAFCTAKVADGMCDAPYVAASCARSCNACPGWPAVPPLPASPLPLKPPPLTPPPFAPPPLVPPPLAPPRASPPTSPPAAASLSPLLQTPPLPSMPSLLGPTSPMQPRQLPRSPHQSNRTAIASHTAASSATLPSIPPPPTRQRTLPAPPAMPSSADYRDSEHWVRPSSPTGPAWSPWHLPMPSHVPASLPPSAPALPPPSSLPVVSTPASAKGSLARLLAIEGGAMMLALSTFCFCVVQCGQRVAPRRGLARRAAPRSPRQRGSFQKFRDYEDTDEGVQMPPSAGSETG